MNDDVEPQVREIVAKSAGRQPGEISLDSQLREDLNLDGDDAEELLVQLRDRFNIDFSGINFRRHFAGETSVWWFGFIEWIERLVGQPKQRFIPITVQDLVEAAAKSSWESESRVESNAPRSVERGRIDRSG